MEFVLHLALHFIISQMVQPAPHAVVIVIWDVPDPGTINALTVPAHLIARSMAHASNLVHGCLQISQHLPDITLIPRRAHVFVILVMEHAALSAAILLVATLKQSHRRVKAVDIRPCQSLDRVFAQVAIHNA
jgi:hypothetical protein